MLKFIRWLLRIFSLQPSEEKVEVVGKKREERIE